MSLDAQTVTFIERIEAGRDALNNPVYEDRLTDVAGCRHRSLSTQEKLDTFGDITTDVWRTTAPPEPVVLAAKTNARLIDPITGIVTEIIGSPKIYPENGKPYKVTIESQRRKY